MDRTNEITACQLMIVAVILTLIALLTCPAPAF
jgi:hypothetical protein